tara:strand:- start:189054 stop:190772 length:1719 start_codon:yes stop_codon:yes gene_type:complete
MRIKHVSITALCLTLGSALLHAAETPDQAWLDFNNARGEAPLIGANADHPLALTAYRPVQAFAIGDIDANKMRLGFDLFHERRLSVDNTVGCNSCHSGMFGGTDGRKVSIGANGVLGNLNAPTTFNAAMNFRQFWDGRAVTLTDQATGPVESELEMAHDLSDVLSLLENDANYPAEFAGIYPDGITTHNMADAIAYFQTVNFTRASTPFVRHLNGEEGQLSEQALRGWDRFDEVGCASCHNGINLGGNSYQQLGAVSDYFVEPRTAGPNDNGLINRSGRENDKHVFKVPTLHGVAETAPYFHDGSVETLEQAIEEMGRSQLGRSLSQQDIDDISAFLRSLGGRPMGMPMMGMGRGMGMRQGGGMQQGGMHQGGMHQGGMHQGGMQRGQGMPGRMNTDPAAPQASASEQTPIAAAPAGSHNEAYQSAIAITETAKNRLLAEMERIRTGEVAHYDFLQYQHLELIRHARALHHPPSGITGNKREQLVSLAEQLLAETNQLEWVIADFLRARALTQILGAHSDQPASGTVTGTLGDTAAALSAQQQLAQSKIRELRDSKIDSTAAQLNEAFLAVR